MRMVNDKLPQDNSNPPSIPDYDQSELHINIFSWLVMMENICSMKMHGSYIRYIRYRYSPQFALLAPQIPVKARGYPLPLGLGDLRIW